MHSHIERRFRRSASPLSWLLRFPEVTRKYRQRSDAPRAIGAAPFGKRRLSRKCAPLRRTAAVKSDGRRISGIVGGRNDGDGALITGRRWLAPVNSIQDSSTRRGRGGEGGREGGGGGGREGSLLRGQSSMPMPADGEKMETLLPRMIFQRNRKIEVGEPRERERESAVKQSGRAG